MKIKPAAPEATPAYPTRSQFSGLARTISLATLGATALAVHGCYTTRTGGVPPRPHNIHRTGGVPARVSLQQPETPPAEV